MERKTTLTHSHNDQAIGVSPEKGPSNALFTGQLPVQNGIINLEERERIEQIWAERAAHMASVETGADNLDEQLTVVLIRLGRELLGLEVQYVFDIRPRESITRMPRVPGWVVGVTNLRGNILSVIDLRKYFGLPGDPIQDQAENRGLLVIVRSQANDSHLSREARAQNGSMEIVFLVDDVLSVETLSARQTAAESGLIHSLRPEYIRAVAERQTGDAAAGEVLAQRHVIILDTEALLADPHLIIHEELS